MRRVHVGLCVCVHTSTCRGVSAREWVRLTPMGAPTQELSLLENPLKPTLFREKGRATTSPRAALGTKNSVIEGLETLRPSGVPWPVVGVWAAEAEAFPRESGARQGVRWPRGASLPPHTLAASCPTALPPLRSACRLKGSAAPIAQKGRLRPGGSRAAQATQQGSSRVRTELQPVSCSLRHCWPPSPTFRRGRGERQSL